MDDPSNSFKKPILHSINFLMNRQRNIAKDHLIDLSNKVYGIFSSFLPLHPEFASGSWITDNFSNCFSFNLASKKKDKICFQELDEMVLHFSSSPLTALVVKDASIKNNIATSISHIHSANQPLIKTVHHTAFVTSTEAKLFTIRCGINQACIKENVSKIIVITNSIHTMKKIFNIKLHPYQSHTIAILSRLHHFFNTKQENSIKFWECPSHLKWRFHHDVDKDLKSFNPTPSFPCKISWNYCKKIDSDDIINQWNMIFQASNRKGRHFLDLVDNNLNIIEPVYTKGGPWLQVFGHSNSLCAHTIRAITNHALIGEYQLRFFSNKDFKYPCSNYPIKSRRHILHECMRFNRYWNLRRDLLSHFTMFLISNPYAFTFTDN